MLYYGFKVSNVPSLINKFVMCKINVIVKQLCQNMVSTLFLSHYFQQAHKKICVRKCAMQEILYDDYNKH